METGKGTQGLQLCLRCFVLKFNNDINRPQRPLAKSVNLIELGGRYWDVHCFISYTNIYIYMNISYIISLYLKYF